MDYPLPYNHLVELMLGTFVAIGNYIPLTFIDSNVNIPAVLNCTANAEIARAKIIAISELKPVIGFYQFWIMFACISTIQVYFLAKQRRLRMSAFQFWYYWGAIGSFFYTLGLAIAIWRIDVYPLCDALVMTSCPNLAKQFHQNLWCFVIFKAFSILSVLHLKYPFRMGFDICTRISEFMISRRIHLEISELPDGFQSLFSDFPPLPPPLPPTPIEPPPVYDEAILLPSGNPPEYKELYEAADTSNEVNTSQESLPAYSQSMNDLSNRPPAYEEVQGMISASPSVRHQTIQRVRQTLCQPSINNPSTSRQYFGHTDTDRD
ncbi:hypothetical protein L3Y34_012369 [Caenorhabditis briggsae]|uniref:Uncharacterized protein n=1 Tax=Caenorhabditis briggsae TaxID=6238 RepID=A0AAE8ZYT2_CAEBR|nr:hypothetical protein L3Y34_012369 [Caenorhabditis briggsae]